VFSGKEIFSIFFEQADMKFLLEPFPVTRKDGSTKSKDGKEWTLWDEVSEDFCLAMSEYA